MLDIIITAIVTILSLIGSAFYIRYNEIKSKKSIKYLLPKTLMQGLFGAGMILSLLAVFLVTNFLYNFSWLFSIKRIVICAILWPIALIDYRKHIISNRIILFLAIVRMIFGVFELFVNFANAKIELISCILACFAVVFLLCFMRLIVRDGIGFGDIKLFGIIGLYFGIKGALPTIFMSFVSSFIISILLLATKKKNRKDYIAFAPSILLGTLLSVILVGA